MTPEQRGLLQKARRNIRSARLLLADGDCDTAISRAYYAMFYRAEALLLSKGLAFSKHSAVIAAFGREFAKAGILPTDFHAHLRDASEARNISDCQLDARVTEEEGMDTFLTLTNCCLWAKTFEHPQENEDS